MSSINDHSHPIARIPPMGLTPQIGYTLSTTQSPDYRPEPQIPVIQQLDSRFYINASLPNPFTVKPIETEWTTNELLLTDPRLRTVARVASLDIAHKQGSNFISPMHLNPGWKWCGGYPNCDRQ